MREDDAHVARGCGLIAFGIGIVLLTAIVPIVGSPIAYIAGLVAPAGVIALYWFGVRRASETWIGTVAFGITVALVIAALYNIEQFSDGLSRILHPH